MDYQQFAEAEIGKVIAGIDKLTKSLADTDIIDKSTHDNLVALGFTSKEDLRALQKKYINNPEINLQQEIDKILNNLFTKFGRHLGAGSEYVIHYYHKYAKQH